MIYLLIILAIAAGAFYMYYRKNIERPLDGGITDNTNYLAPKKIDSHEIKSFATGFYLYHDIDSNLDGQYYFKIENGKLIYKDIEVDITSDELHELDSIIDSIIRDNNMLEYNGYDKVTAGLPPEYQPCYMNIVYESNEKYDYRENNYPYADWAKDVLKLFGEILNKNGYSDLTPSAEAYEIDYFEIAFSYDGETHYYSPITESGVPKIIVNDAYVEVKDNLYEDLEAIIEEYNLEDLHTGKTAVGNEFDRSGDYYVLYITYKNGRRIEGYDTDMSVFGSAVDSLIDLFEN